MVFTSFAFLFAFLPLLLVVYFALPGRGKNLGLLLFICAGPALTLVNKAILDEGFHHPVIVSGFGMGATMVFSQLLVATGQLHVRSRPPGFFLTHCAHVTRAKNSNPVM